MKQLLEMMKIIRSLVAAPVATQESQLQAALLGIGQAFGLKRSWLFAAPSAAGKQTSYPLLAAAPYEAEPELFWIAADGGDAFLADHGVVNGLCIPIAGRGLWLIEPAQDQKPDFETLSELGGLLYDVIQAQRGQNQLGESSARFHAALDALPDLLFEVDAEGRYSDFFSGPRHLMAVPPAEFVGRRIRDVLPADVADIAMQAVETILTEGSVSNLRFELDLPDGRHVFLLSGSRKAAMGDVPATAILIVHEASEIYAMQDEINRLGSITRAMTNLVVIVDNDRNITWVNPAFEAHSGWTLAEIKGQSFADLVRCEATDPMVSDTLDRALRAGENFSGQTINVDRNGKKYYVDFNVIAMFDQSGAPQGYVSVETVVTSLKEQEFAMERLAYAASEAQIRLHNALDALPEGMVIFDGEGQLLVANAALRNSFPKLVRFSTIGTEMCDFISAFNQTYFSHEDEEAPPVKGTVSDLLLSLASGPNVREIRINDGRWFRIAVNRTADGGVIGLFAETTVQRGQMVAIDMANTRLKRALSERAEAEQRLNRIMDATRVGTWELDLQQGVVTVCRQWGQIAGRNADGPYSIPHCDFMEMVHPEDRYLLDSPEPQSLNQDMFEHEFRLRHADGHWIWLQSRGKILRWGHDGMPVQFVGVDLDISEQKMLEDEVRKSSAYFQSAMESNVAAFAIFDRDDILLHCNPEATRILGLVVGKHLGRDPDAEVNWHLTDMEGVPLGNTGGPCGVARRRVSSVRDMHVMVNLSDGRRKALTCNATLVDPNDIESNIVLSFWDITEELNVNDQLRKALAHAEEMSRAKSIFLANMSHEIRTPLNGVLGLAEVLSLQLSNPDHLRMINTIQESGETLLSVLNSVLDMSKIEAGKMEIEATPFVLRDVLRQLEMIYSIQADEMDVEFDIVASSGIELSRIGDPHRLQQVLYNLLSNAFKFSTAGCAVTLSVSCRADRPVLIEVRDTGVGMTEEQLTRVFHSFEQADGSTTRRFGGTGLGLSIVRELVLLMGGQIELQSTFGEGTVVRVSLPLPLEPAVDAQLADVVLH